MRTDDSEAFFRAGRSALRFNAPMSDDRARAIAAWLAARVDTIVDLGCGSGGFVLDAAERHEHLSLTGVDLDAHAIAAALAAARASGLTGRVEFLCRDVADAPGAQASVVIGSAHAFGGTSEMLQKIEGDVAVVGDAVWVDPPSRALVETMGELPAGLPELERLAAAAGWRIIESSLSTLDEWDVFEQTWIGGVRSVGSSDAMAFADEREAEYATYRSVLGFGWLMLER